ncbi:hypothetical protein RPW65_08005 [Pseudomonas sp. NyZ704]|nr:hypothetical protein RPW65_08005 [Pseudomonas sp. NyZ704]
MDFAMNVFRAALVSALVLSLAACSPSESQSERLAQATSVSEVVEAVIYDAPAEAYTVSDTKYMAVLFDRDSVTRDYPLLKAKQLMPVLLERYPDVDRFFFAWRNEGTQFLKIQFDRADVQQVNWDVLMVRDGEVQSVSSMYWSVPALR